MFTQGRTSSHHPIVTGHLFRIHGVLCFIRCLFFFALVSQALDGEDRGEMLNEMGIFFLYVYLVVTFFSVL